MDKQTLSNLIEQGQDDNRKAQEQLLAYAYTPVLWQCRRLIGDEKIAEDITKNVLKSLVGQLQKIESAEHFHKWIGNITASRCMKIRNTIKTYTPDTQNTAFPSNKLSRAETLQVAQILLDALPNEIRICMILAICCRVGKKTIALMTGLSESIVMGYISEGEQQIQEQMQLYRNQGVIFSGSLAVPALLHGAMFLNPDQSAALAMASKLMPPAAPPPPPPVQSPQRPNRGVKILLCVALVLLVVLILLLFGVIIMNKAEKTQETTVPTTTAATEAEQTTETSEEATTEATTVPVTQPATEETTSPETTQALIETTPETKPANKSSAQTGSAGDQGTGQTTTGAGTAGNTQGNQPATGDHTHNLVYMSPYPNFERGPSCESPGWSLFFCTVCREVIAQPDPERRPSLGGHNYVVSDVFEPTKHHQGFTTYSCTKCNDAYRADYVPALTPAPETQPPAVETQPAPVEPQPPTPETQASAAEPTDSAS